MRVCDQCVVSPKVLEHFNAVFQVFYTLSDLAQSDPVVTV
jgi:hypothetical protein